MKYVNNNVLRTTINFFNQIINIVIIKYSIREYCNNTITLKATKKTINPKKHLFSVM